MTSELMALKVIGKVHFVTKFLARVAEFLHTERTLATSQIQELNWLPVDLRVVQIKLLMIFKVIHDIAPSYLSGYFNLIRDSHSHHTRASSANIRLEFFSVKCNCVAVKVHSVTKFLARVAEFLHTERTLATSQIQCLYDYACISWFSGITKNLKDKQPKTN
ncbi:unnamed protein product [Coregonus sp. 'balchen']|nr:unnamed protein product [Coregonus sp. 'balchen']